MPDNASYTKMEGLIFRAGLHRGLKDVQAGTKIPYPTLININRGYQMKGGKKIKYTANRGTRKILEDYFTVPWDEIFEDNCGEGNHEKDASSTTKTVNEAFTITKK